MSAQHQPVHETPYALFDEDELVDDSTNTIPISGLNKPLSLRDRFMRRLSKLLDASVQMSENNNEQSISIFLVRNTTSSQHRLELDNELHQLLCTMEDSLSLIAVQSHGTQCNTAREELWDAVLVYAYANVDHIICSLRQSFDDNKDNYADFLTKMFGIHDQDGSTLDTDLGDQLILLHQSVHGYGGLMKEVNALIHFGSTMTRVLLHLQDRLRYLLGKARFANELYRLICILGFPERVYSTLVRAARVSAMFKHVVFHLRPPTPSTTNTMMASVLKTPSPQPQSNLQPQPPTLSIEDIGCRAAKTIFGKAQMYLERSDRTLGYLELRPTAKRQALIFVVAILDKQYPNPAWEAYHAFGFSACWTEDQKQTLLGLYNTLLTEAVDKVSFFQKLWFAMSINDLPNLFDASRFPNWRTELPAVEYFLTKPPQDRQSVFRLIQFLHDRQNTDPAPCLQRDYGFSFCRQREEVLRIKDVYCQLLQKIPPLALHMGCIEGELYELGYKHEISIDAKNRRLMKNDHSNPHRGVDNGKGLEKFKGSLFKRRLKL